MDCTTTHPTSKEFLLCNYLEEFIETYLIPVFNTSRILLLRNDLHANKNVNAVFFNNRISLKRLYNEALIGGRFTFQSVEKLFEMEEPT